jgi:hypothetical protein
MHVVSIQSTQQQQRSITPLGMSVDAHGTAMPHRQQMRLATCMAVEQGRQQQSQRMCLVYNQRGKSAAHL